jgi:hypothetical protein
MPQANRVWIGRVLDMTIDSHAVKLSSGTIAQTL